MKISFRLRFTVHFLVVTGVTMQIIDVYNRPPPPFVSSHGLESAYPPGWVLSVVCEGLLVSQHVSVKTRREKLGKIQLNHTPTTLGIYPLTNKYENKLLNFCTRHLLDAFTCVFAALFLWAINSWLYGNFMAMKFEKLNNVISSSCIYNIY